MKKTTLVIGCNGQLGSDCMTVFGDAAGGVDFPTIDIADRDLCRQKLDEFKPAVIVNCAAYTAVDACESDPACWKVNADGPGHLAEWAKDNEAFLVHVSTDYVFPGDKPLFQSLGESEVPHPVSEYGRSKRAGEQAILESGASAAILRTAWLYGANGKNFLKTMLRLALQGVEARVVNDQFGSPTWAHTLARQIAAVVDAKATGIFHATSEGYCSWYDLACEFLDQMDVAYHFSPCSSDEYPTPAKRPANSILENAALKKLNLNVSTHWTVELEEFVRENREKLLAEMQ